MSLGTILSDGQWKKIEPLCPGKSSDRGVTAKDNRLFVEAVLWRFRYRSSWRKLPDYWGDWHSIFMRYSRWKKNGVWCRIGEALNDDPGLSDLIDELHRRS